MIGTLNKPTSQSLPGISIKQVPRHRFPQIEYAPAIEPETGQFDRRYVYIYTVNPYLLFLIFILLIMSFDPSYQVIAYRMLDES